MDSAFLVHKICAYYRKAVYVQLIRSTTTRYFRWRQHHPAWERIYPKNKPTKNARNHGNLTKRTSELHGKAINSKKKSHCHLLLTRLLVLKCTRNNPLIMLSTHCSWVKLYILQGSQRNSVFERYNTSSVDITIQNNQKYSQTVTFNCCVCGKD